MTRAAVYRLSDASGRLLYVGMGRNPMGRWASHADQHAWWPSVASFEVTWFASREEAAAEERRALREDGPLHNLHGTPGWGAFLVKANADCQAYGNKAHREWDKDHPGWRTDLKGKPPAAGE
ncbi:hypothetical protein ABZZ79_03335 [Streptomyces sp. NPDC006458]|uniref:hypothetical protein n=1 Tax=Streptomyces sp. NPDC006458 TaxID=3154302 RepID=UPI0033B26A6A